MDGKSIAFIIAVFAVILIPIGMHCRQRAKKARAKAEILEGLSGVADTILYSLLLLSILFIFFGVKGFKGSVKDGVATVGMLMDDNNPAIVTTSADSLSQKNYSKNGSQNQNQIAPLGTKFKESAKALFRIFEESIKNNVSNDSSG